MTEKTQWTPERIGAAAVRALLYELAATPKPGLVDRCNAGAHSDMDFFTFLDSASALGPYFCAVARMAAAHAHERPTLLLRRIRPLGEEAERDMLAATHGVNTHKGAVFTLGVLCTAAGVLAARQLPLQPQAVCHLGQELCAGLCACEYKGLEQKNTLTKGERMYLAYGVTGVRGEAEAGFPHVLHVAYPVLRGAWGMRGRAQNHCLLHALLCLMAQVEDTNVLGRCGPEAARYAKESAAALLARGGVLHGDGMEALQRMDADFTQRGISPGGAADLLAAGLLLCFFAEPGNPTAPGA